MDIKQLRYFIAIAEEGSLSAASHKLRVAQPSLSQHVINLENELEVKLLDRSPRGVSLTEAGTLLLEHARGISTSVDHCREVVRQSGGVPSGSVAFGFPPSISMVLSVPLAETVRVELPNVRLRAIEAMSGFIKTWVEDETVDLGFVYDIEGKRHFNATHLLDETLHFFSAPDAWPLDTAPGSPVPFEKIQNLDLVLPSAHHGLRSAVERYAAEVGIVLNVVIEMDALTQIKELVARGSGYTILSPAAAVGSVNRGELIGSPIVRPALIRPIYLVRNPARPQSHACREVERITMSVVQDLVKRGIWEGIVDSANGYS